MHSASERERRRVQIRTLHETIDGWLTVSGMLRTLDDLNLVSSRFLVVNVDEAPSAGWVFDDGQVGINTETILYVREMDDVARSGPRGEAARFSRAGVRLLAGDLEIQGFMHVPGRGDPMTRLNQDRHAFLALTSVSVVGPDLEFAAPFLAVNRRNVRAAQPLATEDDDVDTPHYATEGA